MKTLSQRNKILLAIAVVVVVVLAVVVFQNPPANALFGATALVITPSNPTVVVGNTTGLSVNSVYNCAWSSSNTAVASLVNYSGETKSVTVQGNAAGSATITAKCGLIDVNKVTTTVTVVLPTPTVAPPTPTPLPTRNPGPTPTPFGRAI
jgi:hypothetical protein